MGQKSLSLAYFPTTQCWWASHSIFAIMIGGEKCLPGPASVTGKTQEPWSPDCSLLLGRGFGDTSLPFLSATGWRTRRHEACSHHLCKQRFHLFMADVFQGHVLLAQALLLVDPPALANIWGDSGEGLDLPRIYCCQHCCYWGWIFLPRPSWAFPFLELWKE